jgi:hypothetical protein
MLQQLFPLVSDGSNKGKASVLRRDVSRGDTTGNVLTPVRRESRLPAIRCNSPLVRSRLAVSSGILLAKIFSRNTYARRRQWATVVLRRSLRADGSSMEAAFEQPMLEGIASNECPLLSESYERMSSTANGEMECLYKRIPCHHNRRRHERMFRSVVH